MNIKKILLSIYLILVSIVGVLRVPVILRWGPDQKIDQEKYAPLWQLQDEYLTISNYTPRYQLDLIRLIYELGIITLILFVVYLILQNKNSKN
ncbi:hypothetical protein [Paenibacillus sp. IHBB 10380]|uniref:hypothetical protein n=1 Tax=Paenibacillus sp. IHBB 10380 TaxID=1566358 RepID=UPI0005CFCFC9|nr:hypothetical protein [Paenibacillus sp. IHBB 10380]AJS59185.1 hypothetical protein UB51_12715 [Paenibacillus sp. IHBB 10380]